MTGQVRSVYEAGLTIPTSKVVGYLLDVADQESMAFVDAHVQNRLANFLVVSWKMGQVEVAIRMHRVDRNALLEVLFK